MPALVEDKDTTPPPRNFTVESQLVELEIDLHERSIKGRTEISIQPHSKESRILRFNCRQCRPTSVKVEGRGPQNWKYEDPYRYLTPRPNSTVHQYHQLRSKIEAPLQANPEPELTITLPKSVQIRESDQYAAGSLAQGVDDPSASAEPGESNAAAGRYVSLTVEIFFETKNVRDGLQWVGCDGSDSRWPHVYTRNSPYPGSACCLFPCVDDLHSRHPWNISIKCPRTLGDAFRSKNSSVPSAGNEGLLASTATANGTASRALGHNELGLSEQESELELVVSCSGELTDEIIEHPNSTWKTVSFLVSSSVSANQIGFAIGPFEDVDLSDFREIDEDERLGEQAVRVHGFCLPGRAAEVRNACMPLAKAIDFFTTAFTTYTGESWKICFVDDLVADTVDTAGFSICSTRLLFPEDIIDTLYTVTRKLVHALAAQYSGINLVPKTANDSWVIAGISEFMTDIFMKSLCGNNEYRYQQKCAADRVFELDVDRPSIYELGEILHLDPSEAEFMALKAGVVLFILDRRLTKSSGSAGVTRIIGRILNNAKAEEFESSFLSTAQFMRLSVKMGHVELDSFFNQWVLEAGCPIFEVRQQFNKKKLCVSMTINQLQGERANTRKDLDPNTFLRDTKEDAKDVFAGQIQPVFTGPMTIRIHEADGTPYEHIIDINKAHMSVDIPYNNKYKRKKSKRQKERMAAAAGAGGGADGTDGQDDVLLYSLGDVLQSGEEMAEWRLTDWTKEMEDKMNDESYEWVRMDADFEWICKLSIHMPAYMWVSQLQQDRDVVAQMESLEWVKSEVQKRVHPLTATFLIRTLLDRRYFHGIRTMAASMLSSCAKAEVDWVGLYQLEKAFQELFCVDGTAMTRPNDFSDRTGYLVQTAILRSLANVKDDFGRTPPSVKRLFMDKLKFNDNSSNEFSDCFYIASLLQCLSKSLLGPRIEGNDEAEIEAHVFEKQALAEIDRYRRIDEWTASYQNIFTTTALDCLLRLAKAKITQPKFSELLQYTRPENSDPVRLKAFDCLVELGMLRNRPVMKYFLHEMSHDPSPYIRENLFRTFGKGLGKIAIGDEVVEKEEPVNDGLVVEQEGNVVRDAKQAKLARKQTTEGALEALKAELGNDESFKKALWSAIGSPVISLNETSNLLDICALLFDAQTALLLKLAMPRYWRVSHEGAGKLTFRKTDKVRWQPQAPLELKAKPEAHTPGSTRSSSPAIPLKQARALSPTLKRKESSSEMTAPPKAKKARAGSPRTKRRESGSSEPNGAGAATKGRDISGRSPSGTPAPELRREKTILKLKVGQRILEATSDAKPSINGLTNTSTNGATSSGANIGYGPVSGAPTAPLGYGRITASPTTAPSPSQDVAITTSTAMSPPPRPTSPALATTTASSKKSKSSTPQPTGAGSPVETHELSKGRRASRTSSGGGLPTPSFPPGSNTGSGSSTAVLDGAAVKVEQDEVNNAAAQPVAPPTKPKLKIRLSGFGGGAKSSGGAGSP